jgi:hypothetical protein
MSPDRSHLCMSLGTSPCCTETLAAVGPVIEVDGVPPHAKTMSSADRPASDR